MKNTLQRGFSPIIAILLIATVVVIGLIVWRIGTIQTPQNNNPSTGLTQSSQETFVLSIKELDVSLTLPNTLDDITYVAAAPAQTEDGKTITRVGFSTKRITSLDPRCSANEGAPLGDLTRVAGQYPTNANAGNSGGLLVKQFPDFYIGTHSLQAQCFETGSVADTEVKTARSAFLKTFDSLVVSE